MPKSKYGKAKASPASKTRKRKKIALKTKSRKRSTAVGKKAARRRGRR